MAKTPLHFFSKTLFAFSLVLGFFLLSLVFFMHSQRLPHIAEWLPAEETEALVVFNAKQMPEYSTVLGEPSSELGWLGRDMALVQTHKGMLTFYEINSRQSAQKYFEDQTIEGEEFIRTEAHTDTEILCFESSFPDCFSFIGPFLVVSSNPEAIEALWDRDEPLANTADYQNVHQRLPYLSSVFAYVDVSQAQVALTEAVQIQPTLLNSVLQLFPAMGLTLERKNGFWYGEAFTAIDKRKVGGRAFFKHLNRYQQNLIPWTPDTHAFEWGGHDLAEQIQNLSTHLSELSPSAALVFDSVLQLWIEEYFAMDPWSLLKKEYYFAWTPEEDFLFMAELEEGQGGRVDELRNNFVERYLYSEPYGSEEGELKAKTGRLRQDSVIYESIPYTQLLVEDENFASVAVYKDTVIVAKKRDTLLGVLDRMRGTEPPRPRLDWPGADEIFGIHMEFLAEEHILKTLPIDINTLMGSTKLFDDGFFNRFILK